MGRSPCIAAAGLGLDVGIASASTTGTADVPGRAGGSSSNWTDIAHVTAWTENLQDTVKCATSKAY
ncbi:hypothetical protein ACEZDB_38455 [Streptacidiphilus sp. N1-3]|uniref:Uncharacterized protein n=1 Tax=Streptacidiphilus alkalitolerans TaxID=3342712 RepID=A0ABV6XE80_9ACTN